MIAKTFAAQAVTLSPPPPLATISEALAEVRSAPQPIALNQVQRRHLAGFVKHWNVDRVARGLAPMLADDALTEGLSALERMMKDATSDRL